MSDLDSRCEKCERDIEQLRGELDALRLQMIDLVEGVLARVDEVLVTVKSSNRQMFSEVDEVLVTVKSANRQDVLGFAGANGQGLCQPAGAYRRSAAASL